MTPTTKIVLAAGANLAAWDAAARVVGLPAWAGLTVAGVSMALATARTPLPRAASVFVQFANAPGNLAVGLLDVPRPSLTEEE